MCGLTPEHGFTLLEVMVSLMLFGIVSAGIMPVFSDFIKHNSSSNLKTQAMAAAQHKLDDLRLQNPQDMPSSGTQGPEVFDVGARSFQVYTTYCAISSFCGTNNNRHLRVEAYYDGQKQFGVDTVFTTLR